ncbi:MAG: YdbL family protein [Candidatus Omnitrophica bacterium]|nr:YdbL family protein [Candidatus Omnitrophota bacterium]
MKKAIVMAVICIIIAIGCARVRVEAPKEAFKVDISMRLDVYQHVAKDIDSIESLVSGQPNEKTSPGQQGSLNFFVSNAWAQENLPQEVEQAAFRRRDRRPELSRYESGGIIGENSLGLVEIRDPARADPQAQSVVRDENADRMAIYEAVARKNSTSVPEVQKLYASRLQSDAPAGTPVQVGGIWTVK